MKFYLQLIFALVSLPLFPGCQKADSTNARKLPPSGDARPSELVILIWDKYLSPDVIGRFEAEAGTTLRQVNFENLGQMMGLIRSNPASMTCWSRTMCPSPN